MHLMIDGYGSDPNKIKEEFIYQFLDTYPGQIGMTKVSTPRVSQYQNSEPQEKGISGFVLLAESHISVHVFPEQSYVNIDVFSCNSYTGSFDAMEDYCGGCGFVDIDFGDELFPQEHTLQHLSIYDGLLSIEGNNAKVYVFASQQQNVMVVEINDERKQPGPIYVDLRMLRDPVVKRRNHTATSKLIQKESRIILTQEFVEPADNGIREGDHYCT